MLGLEPLMNQFSLQTHAVLWPIRLLLVMFCVFVYVFLMLDRKGEFTCAHTYILLWGSHWLLSAISLDCLIE